MRSADDAREPPRAHVCDQNTQKRPAIKKGSAVTGGESQTEPFRGQIGLLNQGAATRVL